MLLRADVGVAVPELHLQVALVVAEQPALGVAGGVVGSDDGVAELEGGDGHVQLTGTAHFDLGGGDLHLRPADPGLLEGVGKGLGAVVELLHAGRSRLG